MESPPGMDPFIEARSLWTDFHDNPIVELQRTTGASDDWAITCVISFLAGIASPGNYALTH